jgi:hypothetical protein
MSERQLIREANKIINFFKKASEGDPFGWDWPTMNMLFPEKVARYEELKAEWKKKYANLAR